MESQVGNQVHSTGWVVQAWASFALSIAAMSIGIINLPVDKWVKGYMGMGLVFTVGSTVSIAKTTRDIHEAKKITARVDEARVEKLLSDHHPLK
ncbi:MAG: YiaA/YiaB family inner membrane protein [Potamolinea sp.]